MTASNRIFRTLALAAVGLVSAGASQAQTWDMDACTGGSKLATGYTGCGTGNAADGTLNIKAYSSTGGNFTTASTSINNGGSYLGVWSGNEGQSGTSTTQVASRASPQHSIDNVTSYGSAYELVHLEFSKAVDLGTLVANWAYSDGDFQVYRWNYNATTADPTITGFNPSSMTGWQLVKSGDFSANYTQTITDTSYFSSHWLVSTAFGHTNDGFKLGTITALSVCATSQTSTGGCAPPPPGGSVPEPSTLAMVLLAGVGVTATRRRRRA